MSNVTLTCRDINELLPVAQRACNLFLSECKKAGINIFITETYRSQARQNYLYEQGRSRPGNVITWTKSSRHTSRLAWDIACNGSVLYDNAMLLKAGEIAKHLGITWGGNWSSPDKPHFEVTSKWVEPKQEDKVEQIQIKLNGKVKIVDAINKDGFNYVKIRDIADDIIEVGYDEAKKLPYVEVK